MTVISVLVRRPAEKNQMPLANGSMRGARKGVVPYPYIENCQCTCSTLEGVLVAWEGMTGKRHVSQQVSTTFTSARHKSNRISHGSRIAIGGMRGRRFLMLVPHLSAKAVGSTNRPVNVTLQQCSVLLPDNPVVPAIVCLLMPRDIKPRLWAWIMAQHALC